MKMVNERVQLLISGAERHNDGDTLAWYAPQRHPSSSPHQLMTLRRHRVLTLVVEQLRRRNPLRRRCLSKQHFVPRQIYIMTHLHCRFYTNSHTYFSLISFCNKYSSRSLYRGGSPTAVQAWRPCPLWEPCPSHPILL